MTKITILYRAYGPIREDWTNFGQRRPPLRLFFPTEDQAEEYVAFVNRRKGFRIIIQEQVN